MPKLGKIISFTNKELKNELKRREKISKKNKLEKPRRIKNQKRGEKH